MPVRDALRSADAQPAAAVIAASSSTASRRSVRTSTTRIPAGGASAAVSSAAGADPLVRGAGGGAQGGQVDPVRGAEDPLERRPRARARPARAGRRSPPPSSFTTTIVRSGRGSPGPITSPFASCRKVRSPSSAYAGPGVRRGRRRPRSTRCRRCRRRRGWPARSRPARGPARNRSRTGLDDPQTSSAAGGDGVQHRGRDARLRQPGLVEQAVHPGPGGAAAARQVASHPSSGSLPRPQSRAATVPWPAGPASTAGSGPALAA